MRSVCLNQYRVGLERNKRWVVPPIAIYRF